MAVRRGISILDLLPQTTDLAGFVPDDIVEQLGVLTVLDHRSTSSADFFLHEGTLQSLADALDIDTSTWSIRIPGLTQGLPFRLALRRAAPVAGGQEAAPSLWALDIDVWDVEVEIPEVRGAKQAGGTGVDPLHLVPLTDRNNVPTPVFLVARGTLRVSGGGSGGTQVQLVDQPDPFDPTAPTGAVIRLTARPPHFLFGQSLYGMTLDQFVIDLSKSFTPAEVVARGHDETWEGVSFHETTFYCPPGTPLLDNLSVSARDVIIGDPGGLQGELRIEFGQDFTDQFNTHVQILQHAASGPDTAVAETTPPPRGTVLQFAVARNSDGTPQRIKAVFGIGDSIPGHSDVGIVGVWWRLPTGAEGNSTETPYFDAPTDGELRYRLRIGAPSATFDAPAPPSALADGQSELAEVRVQFPRTGGTTTANPPLIDAVVDGVTYHNVVHLRGPRERLAGVILGTRGGIAGTWRLGGGSAPTGTGPSPNLILPLVPERTTSTDVTLGTSDGVRRVRVEVVRTGPLAIGHQESDDPASPAAVTVVGAGDASPTEVVDRYRASDFHASGALTHVDGEVTLSGTHITVPQGTIAVVSVPVPEGAGDPLPTVTPGTPAALTSVQILYNFDQHVPLRVVYPLGDDDPSLTGDPDAGKHDPDARPIALGTSRRATPASGSVTDQLRAWIGASPRADRQYFVVGRTDDLKYAGTLTENNTYNHALASDRRDAAIAALTGAGVAADHIASWVEPDPPPATLPASAPNRMRTPGRLALPTGHLATPPSSDHPVWNDRWTRDGTGSSTHADAINDHNRVGYRCAEVLYLDPGTTTTGTPPSGRGVPTNMLVPGRDGPPQQAGTSTTAQPPPTDYRVRLRVRWDSPTVVTPADAIPTEAEAVVVWKPATTELPVTHSTTGTTTLPAPTGADFWEIDLHWTYDARTGETEVTGALGIPSGTILWTSDALAGALAFGPAFTALLDPADTIRDPAGQFVAAAALIGAGAVVGTLINTGAGAGDPHSTVEIDKVTIDYRWNGASRATATLDYVIDLRVNVNVSGAGSLVGHLKLKYKGVGLRFDGGGSGLQKLALTYDSMSVEVVDGGTWSLGGPLGNLIRIAASRIGNGSTWMEFDLEFALDLGVVTLEGATIRLTLEPFNVELRGLTASVDIDDVLTGRGSVTVGDHGAFRALLALQIEPIDLGAYGALAVDQDFVAIEVGVQLPVGLPIANTGLGIYGFMGRFVANGTRNLDGLTNPDPVQRELDWYVRSPEQKYHRLSGQFALGLGAVIGTLPDGGFMFNAEGSLAIGFPDVSVIFGIDAHLAAQRKLSATESGTGSSSTLRILGLTLIDRTSVTIAVRASYQIPKVLTLQVPISAYFPLAGTGAWYIRIGTDNAPSRPGSPVTITIFPSILDVRAWAFVMIEERELHGMGGSLVPLDLAQPLDFDGFSIGMGAGFDLKWSAGPFKLEISAFLLVGIGTKPLLFAGAIGIRGELDLVIVSVGVDGFIHFYVSQGLSYLDGHFCGHVDFFFFSIEGCVDIHIGPPPPSDIPEPEPPLLGVDLCDHLAVVKGAALTSPTGDLPTVWPDTIAVLKFAHYIEDGLGASDFQRRVSEPAALSVWSGATELKYAFRLKTLELYRLTGGDPASDASWTRVTGPFDSAWWLPTHRSGAILGGGAPGPSTEEGRELGLFDWDPRAWSRWLGEGAQTLPGDPANTVGHVCTAPEPANPSCAFGKDAQVAAGTLASFTATPAPGAAIPSRFRAQAALAGGLAPTQLAAVAGDAGWTYLPGAVAALHGAVTLDGQALAAGWRLPSLRRAGAIIAALPLELRFTRPLQRGDVTLEVCAERDPLPIPPSQVCDTMPTDPAAVTSFAGQSGAKYTGKALVVTKFQGLPAVELPGTPMRGEHAPVVSVAVDLVPDTVVTVTALDATGATVGTTKSTGTQRQTLWITATAAAIQTVTIDPGSGKPFVIEVCWGDAVPNPLVQAIAQIKQGSQPSVIAIDAAGHRLPLVGKPVATAPPPALVAAAVAANRCPKLSYHLPGPGDPVLTTSGGQVGVGGWVRVEIGPWRSGDVTLVAACGTTLEAAQSQAQDQGFRDSLRGLLSSLVTAAGGGAGAATHAVYLDRNQTYQLRVAWQYQGFRPAHPGDEPAPPDPAHWIDASHGQRFTFHTADWGTVAAPTSAQTGSLTDPAQGGPGFDERVFDARGLARFVTRATPDHEDPPHFLDDHIGFWFSADHLELLVEKFDRVLAVKILHTTPPPGALHDVPAHVPGTRHVLDVTTGTTRKLETLTWYAADHRFVQAAVAAPCVAGAPAIGSSSVSVTADLLPDEEYDLLLMVEPSVVNAHPEVVVARNHFRTSHYRNPTELLRALGLGSPAGLRAPNDAIATGALAAGPAQVGDAALDAALIALGMDPWPLPSGPRTAVVWSRPTTTQPAWSVVAVLIEADEPVRRAGFKTGTIGEAEPPPRLEVASVTVRRTYERLLPLVGVPGIGGRVGPLLPHPVTTTSALGSLAERVRNAAGTRLLFCAASPIAVTGGRLYDVQVAFRENGATGASGTAPLFDRPLVVFQEGE